MAMATIAMLNVQWLTWDKTTLQMDGVEQFTWAGA